MSESTQPQLVREGSELGVPGARQASKRQATRAPFKVLLVRSYATEEMNELTSPKRVRDLLTIILA